MAQQSAPSAQNIFKTAAIAIAAIAIAFLAYNTLYPQQEQPQATPTPMPTIAPTTPIPTAIASSSPSLTPVIASANSPKPRPPKVTLTPVPIPTIDHSSSPPLPGSQVLDANYREVRKAIELRDYDSFRKFISPRVAQFLDDPSVAALDLRKILSNEMSVDSAGNLIPENKPFDGRAIFSQVAPYEYAFIAPSAEDVELVSVEYNDKFEADGINASAILNLRTKAGSATSAIGEVRFDLVGGAWLYSRESWIPASRQPIEIGSKPSGKTHEVLFDYSQLGKYARDPLSLISQAEADSLKLIATPAPIAPMPAPFSIVKINAGESVKWVNFSGMLFSYASTVGPWDSGYLHGDNFTKTFSKPGYSIYYYNSPNNDIRYSARGIIIVK